MIQKLFDLHSTIVVISLPVGLSGKVLLLVLASTVFLGSESRRDHDRILLSHDSGSRETLSLSESGRAFMWGGGGMTDNGKKYF